MYYLCFISQEENSGDKNIHVDQVKEAEKETYLESCDVLMHRIEGW